MLSLCLALRFIFKAVQQHDDWLLPNRNFLYLNVANKSVQASWGKIVTIAWRLTWSNNNDLAA